MLSDFSINAFSWERSLYLSPVLFSIHPVHFEDAGFIPGCYCRPGPCHTFEGPGIDPRLVYSLYAAVRALLLVLADQTSNGSQAGKLQSSEYMLRIVVMVLTVRPCPKLL